MMNKEKFSNLFPVGSHLCREPMPDMDEMKKDIDNLKEHGFNLIKLQEQWAIDNPKEGVIDLSAYEELIEYAGKKDMGVYFGFTCEQAPAWLYEKYPQARLMTKDGYRTQYVSQTSVPADGKPGPCLDNDLVMEEHLKFITAVVEKLGKYENIVVWNTWQEIGYDSERIIGHETCYCPDTIKMFQSWLSENYGTIENLNTHWKSKYTDWEAVVPNRHVGRFCLPNDIMFDYFNRNIRIHYTLKKRYEAIKKADIYNRPVFAHQGSSTVGEGIDFGYAKCQDFLGASCYPAWFHVDEWDDLVHQEGKDRIAKSKLNEMWEVALKFDYLRSSNRGNSQSWAAEFQGGPICTGLYKGRTPSKADMRRWLLTTLASGTTGVSYWVTRAEIQAHEVNGYSLLDSAGDTTERYEEVSRLCSGINKYPNLFNSMNLEKSEVAIMVSEKNFCLTKNLKGDADRHLFYSTRGWHRLLWELGVSADFVEENQLAEEILDEYKFVVVPFPISITKVQEQYIKKFVQKGGVVLSEACFGRIDEHGYSTRGELSKELREVFGVEHKDVYMVEEPNGGYRWRMYEYSPGDFYEDQKFKSDDIEFSPNLYTETYNTTTSDVLLKNNNSDVVGAVNNYGDGVAYLVGTFIGHNATAYRDENVFNFVLNILNKHDITTQKAGKLLIRKRIDKKSGNVALFITNPTNEIVEEKISLGTVEVDNITSSNCVIKGDTAAITLEPLDVTVLVLKNVE